MRSAEPGRISSNRARASGFGRGPVHAVVCVRTAPSGFERGWPLADAPEWITLPIAAESGLGLLGGSFSAIRDAFLVGHGFVRGFKVLPGAVEVRCHARLDRLRRTAQRKLRHGKQCEGAKKPCPECFAHGAAVQAGIFHAKSIARTRKDNLAASRIPLRDAAGARLTRAGRRERWLNRASSPDRPPADGSTA